MSLEINGKLYKISDTKQVTASFQKREFVVLTEGAYPQHVQFELAQDRCNLLDNYKPNESVKVFFDVQGREWTSPQGEVKYFNTLRVWKLERAGDEHQSSPPPMQDDGFPSKEMSSTTSSLATGDVDDLPF